MQVARGSESAAQLRALVERIEALEEEKKGVGDAIREVYAEAKGAGYDAKTIRRVVRLRAMDAEDREAEEAMLDLYRHALGMLADTPLGLASLASALRTPRQREAAAGLAGDEGGLAAEGARLVADMDKRRKAQATVTFGGRSFDMDDPAMSPAMAEFVAGEPRGRRARAGQGATQSAPAS